MKKLVFIFLMCSVALHAQSTDPATASSTSTEDADAAEDECQWTRNSYGNITELSSLCLYIANGTANTKGGKGIEHAYQRQIMDAACVDIENDSEEEKIRKISSMWAKFQGEKDFICDNYQFDIPDGSVIKFAIAKKFDDFIYDIIDWKIDLNQVDESDGRTVLDYVSYQIGKNKGNAAEKKLKEYYEELRAAGAKHKWEL